jgi:hypothetical protein
VFFAPVAAGEFRQPQDVSNQSVVVPRFQTEKYKYFLEEDKHELQQTVETH